MNLPLWQFGKKKPKDGGLRNGYAVLAAAPEFAERHLKILNRVSESTSWRPKARNACTAVIGCWPLNGDNWLLFRFLDDGVDDHHRPNTMRIEAALAENLPWEEIRPLLHPEAWPAPTPDGAVSINLAPGISTDAAPSKPTTPILCTATECLESPLFSMADSRAPKQVRNARTDTGAQKTVLAKTTTIPTTVPNERKGVGFALKFLIAVLLLAQCCSIFMVWQLHDRATHLEYEKTKLGNAHREETERLTADIMDLKKRIQNLGIEHEQQKQKLRVEIIRWKEQADSLAKESINALPDKLKREYEDLVNVLVSELESEIENIGNHITDFSKTIRTKTASTINSIKRLISAYLAEQESSSPRTNSSMRDDAQNQSDTESPRIFTDGDALPGTAAYDK